MKIRPIKKIMKASPVIEGAGVHLNRAFGYDIVPQLDPFLLFDDFRCDNPAWGFEYDKYFRTRKLLI